MKRLPGATVLTLAAAVFAAPPGFAADPPDELERSVAMMARIGSATSPTFSPDGKRVAFLSNLSGLPQIWMIDARGGYPQAVTAQEDAVASVEWSPDGAWLAFTMAPGGGMNQQIYVVRPDGTGLKRLTDGGKETNNLGPWSHDGKRLAVGSNRRSGAAIDAYLVDVGAGTSRMVTENRGIGGFSDLSQDGKWALLSRTLTRGDNNLYLVEIATGKETLLTPHQGPGSFFGALAPDATALYLASNKDRDLRAFSRVRLGAGGVPGSIEVVSARPDAELDGVELDEGGSLAALIWNVGGKSELEIFDLKAGRVSSRPKLPSELVGGVAFSRDGRELAFVCSGSVAPADVWILDLPSGALRQLTHSSHAGVDLARLVRPELLQFKAHDGLALSGWLYKPATGSAPYPLVVSFHGGPEGQERPDFNSQYQALLARGIAVFAPNVRGSSGFGKRFVNLDNVELRFDGVRDIEACVAAVDEVGRRRPEADRHLRRLLRRLHGRGRPDRIPAALRGRRGPLRRRELRDLLQAHRAVHRRRLEDRVRRSGHASRPAAAPLADPQGGPRHRPRPSSSTAPTTPTCRSSRPSRSSRA